MIETLVIVFAIALIVECMEFVLLGLMWLVPRLIVVAGVVWFLVWLVMEINREHPEILNKLACGEVWCIQ